MTEITPKTWDADHYNESFAFIWRHGAGLIDLLDPHPDERILDLGCGTGHLTAQIAERGTTVIGVDHSAEMIETASATYPSIEFTRADATDFRLDAPVDAVFSNAVLHWVHPPEAALHRVHAALKPGGRLVAEFGGHGNVHQVVTALIEELKRHGYADADTRHPWYFPSIAEYTRLLEQNGFEPTFARLYDRPTLLDGGDDGLAGWLTMFGDPFFGGVSEDDRRSIIDSVVERLRPVLFRDGHWYADYRRLQVVARRLD